MKDLNIFAVMYILFLEKMIFTTSLKEQKS